MPPLQRRGQDIRVVVHPGADGAMLVGTGRGFTHCSGSAPQKGIDIRTSTARSAVPVLFSRLMASISNINGSASCERGGRFQAVPRASSRPCSGPSQPGWLLARRRQLGVVTFVYSVLHAGAYVVRQPVERVVEEAAGIAMLTGWLAFVLLLPLAVTSNDASERLMKRGWKTLHRTVYVIAVLTFAHWIRGIQSHSRLHLPWRSGCCGRVPSVAYLGQSANGREESRRHCQSSGPWGSTAAAESRTAAVNIPTFAAIRPAPKIQRWR